MRLSSRLPYRIPEFSRRPRGSLLGATYGSTKHRAEVAVPDSGQMAARFAQPDKRRRYRDPEAMEKSNEAVSAR